ncbi:MAG: MCE family protein [candidate division Zixibacteria bacterium]|nr:MCE family protein [candidate division Zixibacteria bacterium]
MRSKSIELQVGLVIFIAIILLGYGILWIKEYRFNVERYKYSVVFPEVGSLDIGDPVSVLGVDKGEVEQIELQKEGVYVKFNLTQDVKLRKDAEFVIMNIGLMGERFIQVKPGKSDTLLDLSKPAKGYYDTGIPEVMGMMGRGIDEIRELIRVLKGAVGTEEAKINITEIIDNLLQVTRRTKNLIDKTEGELVTAVNDLSYATASMRAIVDSNQTKLQNSVNNIDSLTVKALVLADQLEEISSNLKITSEKLNSPDNTVGAMLQDREVYDKLDNTITNLDSLILDIKKNPKKYIHLEIF